MTTRELQLGASNSSRLRAGLNRRSFVSAKPTDLSRKVAHSKRASGGGPGHVTMRLRAGLPTMRSPRVYRALERIFRIANDRLGMRICHFSVMSNHIHMLIDSNNQELVSRAMQGLCIRIAKALNRGWKRAGQIFDSRYDLRWIPSVMGVRRVVRYVLQNARKHGVRLPDGTPDPYSSARWHRWDEDICRPMRGAPVVQHLVESFVTLQGLSMSQGMSLYDLPGTRMSY